VSVERGVKKRQRNRESRERESDACNPRNRQCILREVTTEADERNLLVTLLGEACPYNEEALEGCLLSEKSEEITEGKLQRRNKREEEKYSLYVLKLE